jgi:hypothetical protein
VDNIEIIIGAIFGTGGAGALMIAVTAYRKIKRGAIDDDEAIIRRLYEDNTVQRDRAERAEAREAEKDRRLEMEIVRRRSAEEQAWVYKAHIVSTGAPLPTWPTSEEGK